MEIRAPKGTRDILPPEVEVWQWVERTARGLFARYGFREIRTPMFEPTELFARATGSDTEIVIKEMYTFSDRAGRSLTLRPEGTPSVVRAMIEGGWLRRGGLDRLYYIGPMFRYERPQKGRYRQFSQIGVEAFGSSHAAVDVEVMEMALSLFSDLGIRDASLQVNSVGHPGCRPAYREALRQAIQPLRERLCPDCQRRLEVNPLRILDCKVPSCQPLKEAAPEIRAFLCADCADHMDRVQALLDRLQAPYALNPRLVRGLDYYTRTTFEVTGAGLGAQSALCGGGRYDDLVASMGGPPTPGVGFAIGADRLVSAAADTEEARRACSAGVDVYIVHLGEPALGEALAAARGLRRLGVSVTLEPDARDLKKQMSRAAGGGARFALIIGERERERGVVALKRLSDGAQREVATGDWEAIASEVSAHPGKEERGAET